MNRNVDFKRQWAAGRDIVVHIVCYGGSRARVSVKADGGPRFDKLVGSQDEAVQTLPEIIAEYQSKLHSGHFHKEREIR
jgi:hypothetical protein